MLFLEASDISRKITLGSFNVTVPMPQTIDKIQIGDRVRIGSGLVVLRDVPLLLHCCRHSQSQYLLQAIRSSVTIKKDVTPF